MKTITLYRLKYISRSITLNTTIIKRKEFGLPVLDRLPNDGCSQARSHYCPTRVLLAARSPAWPSTHLLRQPGDPGLLQGPHIDARLSADTRSTQTAAGKGSRPQEIHKSMPPGSRITGARHHSQRKVWIWRSVWCGSQSGAHAGRRWFHIGRRMHFIFMPPWNFPHDGCLG